MEFGQGDLSIVKGKRSKRKTTSSAGDDIDRGVQLQQGRQANGKLPPSSGSERPEAGGDRDGCSSDSRCEQAGAV
ncbi:hypothetical protein EJ110_NYTH06130 [Nymphaea thermarum]|nr:hypothetical protein EJ110_NYTH06130 [Nymphaea thermarum]